jgi:hypothetical protein
MSKLVVLFVCVRPIRDEIRRRVEALVGELPPGRANG